MQTTSSATAPSSNLELTKKGESYVAAALAEANGVFFLTLDRNDRLSIETAIQRLIDVLDAMDPDSDQEGDYADWEPEETDENQEDWEPTTGSPNDVGGDFDQTRWAFGSYGDADECEEENEHGGDINDKPHDDIRPSGSRR